MSGNEFYYSPKYYDDKYEYRHVVLPKELVKLIPKSHLMSEKEWRDIGIQQSEGWIHYMVHKPEPHIVLFKRPITSQSQNRAKAVPGQAWSGTPTSNASCSHHFLHN